MKADRAPAAPLPAWVGLGSNLDDPSSQLDQALGVLATRPAISIEAVSGYYRNPPMGPQRQPDYVNAVARLRVGLSPLGLLDELLAIEAARGRRRDGLRWGARVIDLDLLLYSEVRVSHPRLDIPHPGLAERAFVLQPLAELNPGLIIPGRGALRGLLAGLDTSQLVPL